MDWETFKHHLQGIDNEESVQELFQFIDKIHSVEKLKEFYYRCEDILVKAYLIRKIYYEFHEIPFLEQELMSTDSEVLETTIIPFIKNEDLLKLFVETRTKNVWSKVFAVKNITDSLFLAKIILKGTSNVLIWTAIHQISDEDIIFDLLLMENFYLDEFIIRGLLEKMESEYLLLQLKLLLPSSVQHIITQRIDRLFG